MFEDVNLLHCVALVFAGICAGFFNVFAGGGSLITLPILMDFVGLPAAIANGTNRFGILSLNAGAIAGFQSKGYKLDKYTITLGIVALIFAIIGAQLSIGISDDVFKKILAVVMIFAIVATVIKPMLIKENALENMTKERKIIGILAFAGVGFYGGLIQAGVGFVIITLLSLIHNMKLTKLNSVKVAVVGIYGLAALAVFIYHGKYIFIYGLLLAIVILALLAIKIFFFDN